MSVYAQDYGYFFNSNSNDRTYNADSFETWLKPFFVSGVFTGCLQVQAQSTPDMTVKVTKGYANLDGKAAYWPSDNTLTIETASGIYDRIDTIVLRRDNTNRRVSLEVVKGTASASPSPTAPTRNSDTYELVLAEVLVGTGVTEIAGSAITDKRPDTDVCGYVVAAVQTPDFSELYAQFAAQAEEFMGDQADEFLAWFDEMKDQLSEDAAGHLQLEIDGKTDKVTGSLINGRFAGLDSNGNLTNSGYKPADFLDVGSVSYSDYGTSSTTPSIGIPQGRVFTHNGFVYKAKRNIAGNVSFSSLGASDITQMRLAYDLDALNSNCPEIVTNANGTALKFPTGLMICYKNVSQTISMTTSWGSLYEGSIALGNWAVEFTDDVPTCTCANNTNAGAMLESWNGISKSSAGTAYFARGTSGTNIQLKIGVTAYGKWK